MSVPEIRARVQQGSALYDDPIADVRFLLDALAVAETREAELREALEWLLHVEEMSRCGHVWVHVLADAREHAFDLLARVSPNEESSDE